MYDLFELKKKKKKKQNAFRRLQSALFWIANKFSAS